MKVYHVSYFDGTYNLDHNHVRWEEVSILDSGCMLGTAYEGKNVRKSIFCHQAVKQEKQVP